MNLTKVKQHCSALLSVTSLCLGFLLLSILLSITSANAKQVPASVYSRYITLTTAFAKMSAQDEKQTKAKVESNKILTNDIADFYQQQRDHSTERQLLASNLQLQVLLMPQNSLQGYEQAYQVVTQLLSLSLELEQQLIFQQLAAQLAASLTTETVATKGQESKSWNLVAKHLNAWFTLVDKLDEKQHEKYKITIAKQASNAALLAQAYYLQDKLTAALTPSKRAYQLVPKNESYLQLLLALLQRLEQDKQLNKHLEIAVVDFPKSKDYWERLAYSYLTLEQNKSALSTLAITRNQGLLTAQGYRVLASLYLQQQQPRLAAAVYLEGAEKKLLQQDSAYFKGLSNAWLMARERSMALIVLAQAADAGIKLAKHDQQQAQLLYLEARWSEAELAYAALLDHGVKGEDQKTLLMTDKWRFLLAVSQIEQGKKAQAKDNLLLLQTKQYQGYSKGWLAQL
ncbi:TPR domain protein, putative component of TonB system [Moritella sp. JT01]|uniref:hypothetical protein n=1 Tax=Moritella sp. JT01 TaxID=756698 RepID=UPI0007973A55|nr:hypothetical protein [Moritella sp. JT01]KXO07414.1 TPR domain protein, putative component of TonB system [Moritella sp. JT01]